MLDWSAIQSAFERGEGVSNISQQHGCAPSTIYRRALRDGWFRQAEAEGSVSTLAEMALKLQRGLDNLIHGEPTETPVIGDRESPSAMLLRLAKLFGEIGKLEQSAIRRGEGAPTRNLTEEDRDIISRFEKR